MGATSQPMNSSQWNVAARLGGFQSVTAFRPKAGQKWLVKGRMRDDEEEILRTMRNHIREFSNLGTVAKYLADLGVGEFEVQQPPAGDLLDAEK